MPETNSKVCYVLSPLTECPSSDVVARELKAEFGADVQITHEKGQTWMLEIPGSQLAFLSFMPVRVPDEEAEANADGNLFWPNAREELADYKTHVIAGVMGGPEDPVELNFTLSRLARSALKAFEGLGVYWGDGAITNSRNVFLDLLADSTPEAPPLTLWVRFQPYRTDTSGVGFYTLGMEQFGLMDIEVDSCARDPVELTGFMHNIASYLIENGPVIKDGDTIGGDENERIRVTHSPSIHDEEKKVYRVWLDGT